MLPPSVAQAGAALRAAAGQKLAAIGGRHALAETVDLGTLALLGLIGTLHAGTPPVQFGGPPPAGAPHSTTPRSRGAVGKISEQSYLANYIVI